MSEPISELARQIDRYCQELTRAAASPHTLDAYSTDLRQFCAFLSPPETEPPAPEQIDLLLFREWLADLYGQELSAVTIRRKLAAVRSFFGFLLREGVVSVNRARLVRTPKAPKKLPEVMTAEQTNSLLDGVAPVFNGKQLMVIRIQWMRPARDITGDKDVLDHCPLTIKRTAIGVTHNPPPIDGEIGIE